MKWIAPTLLTPTPAPDLERPLLTLVALGAAARGRRLRRPLFSTRAVRTELARVRSDLIDLTRREARAC